MLIQEMTNVDFKSYSYLSGLNLVKNFYNLNKDKLEKFPKVIGETKYNSSSCGLYYPKSKKIVVYLPSCAGIARTKRQWSWMGYKVNRTPQGVVAHEFGHYVDDILGWPSHKLSKEFRLKKVSGYEPNKEESFAESMKLFITNPDFLKRAFPLRYDFLTKKLGLKPLDIGSYDQVLELYNAPERFIKAATNVI